jgi:hypothetical protein
MSMGGQAVAVPDSLITMDGANALQAIGEAQTSRLAAECTAMPPKMYSVTRTWW